MTGVEGDTMMNLGPACRGPGSIARIAAMYDEASVLAKIGAWECVLATETLTWTNGVYDLFGLPRGSALRRPMTVELYEDESRQQMETMRAEAIRSGGTFTLDAQIRTSKGDKRWMRLSAAVACQDGRPVRIFGAKQDITHEIEMWTRLRQLAEYDSLTGLANRGVFEARLHEVLGRDRDELGPSAFALVDLDRFKPINDRFGHAAGDECLRQVAARLARAFADAILVARIGGDEFAVLMRAPLGRPHAMCALERALAALCRPVPWKGTCLEVGASVGVTFLERSRPRKASDVFAEADSALYAAKAAGRNAVRAFGTEPGGEPSRGPVDMISIGREAGRGRDASHTLNALGTALGLGAAR